MNLFGMGANHTSSLVCTDDYWLDPPRDLAIVTSGLGVDDRQARPAAVLALWSVVGEVAESEDAGALARGARRAHEALERITLGWQRLIRPTAMLAAVRVAGSRAQLAHVGRCRISRVGSGGLEALTEDHDLARAAAAADPTGAFKLTPPDLARVTTRALGVTDNIDVREVDVQPGDELLLATPGLHDRLTAETEAELCRRDRPLVARAIALMDHACARQSPFAFVLVRVVPDGPRLRAAGWSRPPAKCFYFAPGEPLPPPVEGLDRGPDERWYKEIADNLTFSGIPPLNAELEALADLHPPELCVPALIRAIRWCLRSLAGRFRETPPPLLALIDAIEKTEALADWDDSRRAIEEAFYAWAEHGLGDWASQQAIDRVKDTIDCLVEWATNPDRPEQELGGVLQDLVYAEGMWDWDELAAEAALSGFAPIPDEYWDMEIHRDEKRVAARRALIQVLAEVAPEPWVRGGDLDKQPQRP